MCALTKSILPEFDTVEPPAASPINFDVLKDLARLDGHREQHGSLLGTSAVHALLLQALVDQVKSIACEIKGMKIDAQDDGKVSPTGGTSGAATPKPAPAAVASSRFGVVATVDAASVQAISGGVATVLAQTVHQPLTEIRGTLKTQGEDLVKVDAQQSADRKQLDALAPEVGTLQKSVEAIMQRLDRLDRAVILTGQQLLKLHGAVGGLSGDVAGLEEMTEAVRRHVAALDVEVAVVEAEIEAKDEDTTDPRAKRPAASRKPKNN